MRQKKRFLLDNRKKKREVMRKIKREEREKIEFIRKLRKLNDPCNCHFQIKTEQTWNL